MKLVPVVKPIADKEKLLHCLAQLREDVESGFITGLAVAAACRTGETLSAVSYLYPQCNVNVLLGALWVVNNQMQNHCCIQPDKYDGDGRPAHR